ncbi:hypothetical protein TraAM80_05031 [Trypanosoma rangeli]|uniref:Uncharacterized protein n=1 Tax=Trypanosoma rangeli TaxID=5698 RepID=A0A422NHE0_TRYRA|nr:uncharacterized protein TraAM80_05031 [Trypanosoma rangeli]RNF04893.1 hypothetical protein TraAM80_05031 [Trypanosoma rangeli]|eukprot:RNF04893.1 hypothetical protein TraAM80_05031 [Trypanosoma rangeli]
MTAADVVIPLQEECADSSRTDTRPHYRFFFLNSILCRTETADASFRPSDVFVGRDPPPRGTATLGDASRIVDDATAPTFSADVDRDCPIFNTFGVLSGGVLIDPNTRCFVDFVDDAVVAPAMSQATDDDNVAHYESLAYAKIRAEGAMCLCSSIEPLNAPGTRDTPLSWPRSLRLAQPVDARVLALRNVYRVLRRCVAGAPVDRETLTFLEVYRCHLKSKRPTARFMTENIPFRFQHGGRAVLLQHHNDGDDDGGEEEGERECEEVEANDKTRKSGNGGGGSGSRRSSSEGRPIPTGGSPFSEFHTFTGLPKMASVKHEEKVVTTPGHEYAMRLEMRLQRLVRPQRDNLSIGKRPRCHPEATEFQTLWWTFLRYVPLIRVCPSPAPNAEGRTEWYLADDSDVKYRNEVLEFEAARAGGGGPRWSITAIADAWDWLLRHDRERLLRRLARLKRCVEKLQL